MEKVKEWSDGAGLETILVYRMKNMYKYETAISLDLGAHHLPIV